MRSNNIIQCIDKCCFARQKADPDPIEEDLRECNKLTSAQSAVELAIKRDTVDYLIEIPTEVTAWAAAQTTLEEKLTGHLDKLTDIHKQLLRQGQQ